MSIFDFFRKKKTLSEDERKWNLMWDLWTEGKAESPYSELMEYESEVNNGGHSQYFFNVSNTGDLPTSVDIILAVLPEPLRGNLKKAYDAFAAQKDPTVDANEELFEMCDDVFWENEHLLMDVLKEYADRLSI